MLETVKYDGGGPLKQFKTSLVDLWRAASRDQDLPDFLTEAIGLLGRRLDLTGALVVRADVAVAQLSVLAGEGPRAAIPLTGLDAAAWANASAWLATGGGLVRQRAGAGKVTAGGLLALVGSDEGIAIRLGTVADSTRVTVLILHARQPGNLSKLTDEQAESIAEPFATAVERDERRRELNALREVAEEEAPAGDRRRARGPRAEAVVGAQGGLRQVMERVGLVARSDLPVLLFGETGSGKEVIARAIHEQSPRVGRPFVRVNCGAIAPELIDSELFGHERGAFTGAVGLHRGWFERASGGTLLLDEIGELPPAAQVRLLRVLQDGAFTRVGGERTVRVDVRVVVATHRDLPGMVQEGTFREDLWYRIASFPIVLPPLRERRQDIPLLAEHVAHRAARRFGLRPQLPTPADLDLLVAYPWPGNVRELISVIDRAAILGEGKRLDIARALGAGVADERGGPPRTAIGPGDTLLPLAAAMRAHIEAALAATRGRIEGKQGAAQLLDINPHTLRARMRKLGIDGSRFR